MGLADYKPQTMAFGIGTPILPSPGGFVVEASPLTADWGTDFGPMVSPPSISFTLCHCSEGAVGRRECCGERVWASNLTAPQEEWEGRV